MIFRYFYGSADDTPLFLTPSFRRGISQGVYVCSFLLVRHIDVVIRNRYFKEYYASLISLDLSEYKILNSLIIE